MLWHMFDEKPWFAPKRIGYGAGLPIAWQGWALLAAHIALIAGLTLASVQKPLLNVILIVAAAILPLPLYARKTRGGWKWRNGRER